ncbi:hypothetical protein BRD13_03000 [Halobacteriales archaeon SW_5_70_135]|nr:MAG: hypothetical protein BRD13_03000 [Halobacteriales archaeon SW_5_70_135]
MRVRGERECRDCGRQWSYFETGAVECPACGSLRSVGRDERRQHTDAPVDLDLTAARETAATDLRAALADARERCRAYVRRRGFVDAGHLRDLDDVYLAAAELAHAADAVDRGLRPEVSDAERIYLLGLLSGADAGDRPDVADVPASLRSARGLAVANAVRDYRRELRDWLAARDEDDQAREVPAVRGALDRTDGVVDRHRALQGDVPPAESDTLVAAVRDLAHALRDGDENALVTARDRLDGLTA